MQPIHASPEAMEQEIIAVDDLGLNFLLLNLEN